MHIGTWAQLAFVMVLPTLVVALGLRIGPGIRAVRRWWEHRRSDPDLVPVHPPIERLAADLRRLLLRHDAVRRSTDLPMRAQRIRAVEGAITDCASEAAAALGVERPALRRSGRLPASELRTLLGALADAGLVLPPSIGLLARPWSG